MYPNRRFAVLIAVIAAVVGLVVWSPWSSGEDQSKDALLARVSKKLEESQAPPELRRCFVGALAKHLTEDEVQSAYDSLPNGAEEGALGVVELSPELRSKLARYGLLCFQHLMRSGKYKPREITEMLRGFAH